MYIPQNGEAIIRVIVREQIICIEGSSSDTQRAIDQLEARERADLGASCISTWFCMGPRTIELKQSHVMGGGGFNGT